MSVCFIVVQLLSLVLLFSSPWTVACQALLSMRFSRQEYWSGLPCPSPGDLLRSGIKPASPALASGFFTTGVYMCMCVFNQTVLKRRLVQLRSSEEEGTGFRRWGHALSFKQARLHRPVRCSS